MQDDRWWESSGVGHAERPARSVPRRTVRLVRRTFLLAVAIASELDGRPAVRDGGPQRAAARQVARLDGEGAFDRGRHRLCGRRCSSGGHSVGGTRRDRQQGEPGQSPPARCPCHHSYQVSTSCSDAGSSRLAQCQMRSARATPTIPTLAHIPGFWRHPEARERRYISLPGHRPLRRSIAGAAGSRHRLGIRR
jgi:hypothetical protein